jgi:DNA-binding transcriptional regulator YhcF (GntR family)
VTNSTDAIHRALTHKILTGQYAVGSKLPTCRGLAIELGVNRNTISKVYQALAREGIVQVRHGLGVFVSRAERSPTVPMPGVRTQLLAAAREAKLLGMDMEAFLQAATEIAGGLFEPRQLAIAFVECNKYDAESLARELEAEVSCPMQPIVLSALERAPDAIAEGYDVICTTLGHLAAVNKALGMAKEKVVAVQSTPKTDVLFQIAHGHSGATIGVICETPATQQYLLSAVGMLHDGQIRACLLADKDGILEMGRSVDLMIDVPSCHTEVGRLLPSIPILTVTFCIDSKSLAPLRERILMLREGDGFAEMQSTSFRKETE